MKHNLAMGEITKPMQPPTSQEVLNAMGSQYYLLMDDLTLEQVVHDPETVHMIPAISQLNRTTKVTPSQAELQMLDYEYLMLIHNVNMDEDDFDARGWSKMEALKLHCNAIVYDQIDGHRAKLLTETKKIIEAQLKEAKEKGRLGL